jgi:hypothetical protein
MESMSIKARALEFVKTKSLFLWSSKQGHSLPYLRRECVKERIKYKKKVVELYKGEKSKLESMHCVKIAM